jgi:hypothetical protein
MNLRVMVLTWPLLRAFVRFLSKQGIFSTVPTFEPLWLLFLLAQIGIDSNLRKQEKKDSTIAARPLRSYVT